MRVIAIMLFILISLASKAGEISIEGIYDGKNVFIANPVREDGTFCAYYIYVNDRLASTGANSSSFEINLAAMGIKIGTKYTVRIVHHDNCKPTFLSATK